MWGNPTIPKTLVNVRTFKPVHQNLRFSILILQFQGLNRSVLRVLKHLGMKSKRNHEPGVKAPELSKQPESEYLNLPAFTGHKAAPQVYQDAVWPLCLWKFMMGL
jgi:hypothetical protein